MAEVRRYITCPVCNEEIQEDTTLYINREGDICGCDWCMNVIEAGTRFEFWEDEEEELCRLADDMNDIARWERMCGEEC